MTDFNIIPDSYSSEIIILMVFERIWVKIRSYMDNKSLDDRLDKMSEDIAHIKGQLKK